MRMIYNNKGQQGNLARRTETRLGAITTFTHPLRLNLRTVAGKGISFVMRTQQWMKVFYRIGESYAT